MEETPLRRLVSATEAVRATSSRKAKAEHLAELLAALNPTEIVPAIGMLLADPRQGAIGVGWATVSKVKTESGRTRGTDEATGQSNPGPSVLEFDELLSRLANTTGPGSTQTRLALLGQFVERCDAGESEFVGRVLIGDARQGALAGVMSDAAAKAAGVKAALLRRAAMLRGDLAEAAAMALLDGSEALEAVTLEVGRPVQPMLASTAADIDAAMEAVGLASVQWKLDGIRVQVHRAAAPDPGAAPEVTIVTRNLNDITEQLPGVVRLVRSLRCRSVVLDGELLGLHSVDSGLPDETDQPQTAGAHFFDVLYLDGASLIDRPLLERLAALDEVCPEHRIPHLLTDDVEQARTHLDEALAAGHEGVMVKGIDSRYEAGRRGKAWRKVKPVYTLDLVVLGAEWGHGRRQGWLSNLHLGALDPQTGEPVMVGKTFKGLTDELLRWQTEELLARKTDEQGITVFVRPELIVEIALDSAHTSTRYPGGVALRFARVRRYRADKELGEADTLEAVRRLLPD